MRILNRLLEERKKKGLTQVKLAVASGVSQSVISEAERGKIDCMRVDNAKKIAAVLAIDWWELYRSTPVLISGIADETEQSD